MNLATLPGYLKHHLTMSTHLTSYLKSHTSHPIHTSPVDGDIVPDQSAVEVIVLPPPSVEAVAEAVDHVETRLVEEDNPARVLGVAQSVAPPRHGDCQVEDMKSGNSTN